MKDTRLHNDCDGGQCCACEWDRIQRMQARLRADRRAWFDPNASYVATPEEVARMMVENALKSCKGS